MTRRDWIKEQVGNLPEHEYVKVWNDYCEANGYTDGIVRLMDDFNDMFKELTPLEIIDISRNGKFNTNDTWFVAKEMYGWEVSSDCDARYLTEEDELIDYIEENPEFYQFLDDDDYRTTMSEGWDPDVWRDFENWFDDEYGCQMFEIDFDTLVNDWHNSVKD